MKPDSKYYFFQITKYLIDIPWYHQHSRQGCAVWLFKPELRTNTTKEKTARNCTEKLNYFICTEGIP